MLLGFGHRPPEPPVTGRAAQTKWWERIRSLIFLAALVAGLGLLLAGFIGGTIFLGGYLLEQAV